MMFKIRKNCLLTLAAVGFGLFFGRSAQAQPYSNAVMALNPVAYLPLTETTPPPYGYYVATNSGSAGASGNGYYQTWYHPVTVGSSNLYYISNNIVHAAGATGDGDLGLQCNYSSGRG